MSRDIRSFFTVVSKKTQPNNEIVPSKKRTAKITISSDEDIINETPEKVKDVKSKKKRKVHVISSDSEDDCGAKQERHIQNKMKKKEKETKTNLKPVSNLEGIFGTNPIAQSKIEKNLKPAQAVTVAVADTTTTPNTELGIHDDDSFEKTLLDLDDDILLQNMNILDKTAEEALAKEKEKSAKKNVFLTETRNRKRKLSENFSDGDPDQERYEKRRQSAVLYQKYLNRGGPPHWGSKEVPKGKPDCFKNLCFLRTGVLDSLDGNDFENAVKEHGGRTVHAVSKKINYVVIGEEPGPAKLEKAKNYSIPIISEDEFLDLIRTKSGMSSLLKENEAKSPFTKCEEMQHETVLINDESPVKSPIKSSNKVHLNKLTSLNSKLDDEEIPAITTNKQSKIPKSNLSKLQKHPQLKHCEDLKPIERTKIVVSDDSVSWTEKYKPRDTKSIIGQQGDKSNMRKLVTWLSAWHKNHSTVMKQKLTKPSPWAKSDDGSYFKCALLSGPPGVGKTTTATLVANELGFDIVEFNASDTRSKKLLHEEVAQLLSTTTIAGFATSGSSTSGKRVLIMDEVDGMAGNEDRGGIQELIALIKHTKVPIICMCNDRNHTKVRSLANYCFDLRFSKPRIEQIRGAMMTVCFKEGIKISPAALNEIVNGAGMDIRQTLNHLSMWTASEKVLTEETAEKEANASKKDVILGPWEVVRQVFSKEDHKNMSVADKARLFYYDYSIGPLFVQENYLKVVPHAPKKEFLERAAKTAESISMADVTDAKIRRSNNWSLLETQAIFASVLPGHYMEGHMGGQINFPSWLGKNSKRTKFQRLLSEVQTHARMSISGSRLGVNLDYLVHLRDKIITPLVKDGTNGVEESVSVMNSYNLLREDLDGLLELSQWPGRKVTMAQVDSKVKAAFTRAYNKRGAVLPYSIPSGPLKKRAAHTGDDLYNEEEEETQDYNSEEDDDVTRDANIKEKKQPASKTTKKGEVSDGAPKGKSSKGKTKKLK